MSDQVNNAFVEQFKANVIMLAQQRGSRLRGTVRTDPELLTGKYGYFERIGAVAASKRTTRHGDTPLMNTPHSRRRVEMSDYEWADLIDHQDKLKMLIDPEGPYSMSAMWALGRSMDDVIIDALGGNAYSIDADDASSTVALPSGQKVAVSSAGLTKAKLLEALQILRESDIEEDEPLTCVVAAQQITDLLNTTEVASADYNTVKALAEGTVNTWMGMRFVRTQRLDLVSSVRYCYVYPASAIGLVVPDDINVRMSERADKSYAMQVYARMSTGATRVEDEKVVEIACSET